MKATSEAERAQAQALRRAASPPRHRTTGSSSSSTSGGGGGGGNGGDVGDASGGSRRGGGAAGAIRARLGLGPVRGGMEMDSPMTDGEVDRLRDALEDSKQRCDALETRVTRHEQVSGARPP